MSKTETLRQSAQAKNETRLETLAQQVEAVRQAKSQSVEELAATLEPLAKALAALSDETAKTLTEIDRKARETSAGFRIQLENATADLNTATAQARRAAASLNRASTRLEWRHYALALTTGLVSAVLISGFWLWFRPPIVQTQLDPQAVAEYLKPAVISALKPAKAK